MADSPPTNNMYFEKDLQEFCRFFSVQTKQIDISLLRTHEQINFSNATAYWKYISSSCNKNNQFIMPTIIIDEDTQIIIDGHHRYYLLKTHGAKNIWVTSLKYQKELNNMFAVSLTAKILVHPDPNKEMTKQDVIIRGFNSKKFASKTTEHMVRIAGEYYPITILSRNMPFSFPGISFPEIVAQNPHS